MQQLRTVPLAPPVGVEVLGFDLSRGIDEDDARVLRQWLLDHQLLVFRGLRLAASDQVEMLRAFGPICIEAADGSPCTWVSNERADGRLAERNLPFHSDFFFTAHPHPVLSLYAEHLEGRDVPTDFANAVRACATLPDVLRRRVEGRTATHVNDYALDKSSATGYGDRVRLLDMDTEPPYATHPRVTWPVMRPHPESGRPILHVSELHTSHVSGLTSAESENLVHELFRHLHDPRALYSHHWREGDLVVWDNIAMRHGRRFHSDTPAADAPSRRTLRRVAVNAKSVEQILEGVDTGRRNLRLRIGEGAERPAT